jgi:hypothetical protein
MKTTILSLLLTGASCVAFAQENPADSTNRRLNQNQVGTDTSTAVPYHYDSTNASVTGVNNTGNLDSSNRTPTDSPNMNQNSVNQATVNANNQGNMDSVNNAQGATNNNNNNLINQNQSQATNTDPTNANATNNANQGVTTDPNISATVTDSSMNNQGVNNNQNNNANMNNNANSNVDVNANNMNNNMTTQRGVNNIVQTGLNTFAALPLLNTYVPDAVVNQLKGQYGDKLYDITMLKVNENQFGYAVRTQDNGVYTTTMVNDTASNMNQQQQQQPQQQQQQQQQ